MKIPKKASKPLLEEIQLTSPQYKNEILPELVNAVRSINLKELIFRQIFMVNNESLSAKYNSRRQKMTNKSEEFAFLRVPSLDKARELVDSGIPVSSELSDSPLSALGNPKMGVYLSKFLDYSSEKAMAAQEECVFIMCKVLKGKWKSVVESESLFDPTYDFDSHVSKSAGTHGLVSSIQNNYQFFMANQIFLFEYNQDMETEKYPSNVLPFAVLCVYREVMEFNMSSNFSPLKSISVTAQNPSIRPLKPLPVWLGKLVSDIRCTGSEENNAFTEDSVLVSFYSRVNPVKIPDKLEVSGWLDLSSLSDYFSEKLFCSPPAVSGISQVQDLEVAESMFYAYFQLMSQRQIEEIASNPDQVPRSDFVEYFHNPLLLSKAAAASLGDSYLYMLPPGEQVQRIGITNEFYNPSVIHCLLVSSKKVYNTCSALKATKVYSNEFVVSPPSLKDIAVEQKAFKAEEFSQEVQNSIAKVCNFALNKQLAETDAAPMEPNFSADVYTNTFDCSYFSVELHEIPEMGRLADKALQNAKELQRSHEKFAEQRERAAKQRELEEMRAQVASIEESHRRNVEKEMASNQPPQNNSFSLPLTGLQRSFKKKTDGSQSSVNGEKAPKPMPPVPQVRKSVLGSMSGRSNNNDIPARFMDPGFKSKMLNARRVDEEMPLFESTDSPTESDSGYNGNELTKSKPSSPQYYPYPRKAGGLLDMPLPPVLNSKGSRYGDQKPPHDLHSELQTISDDDMDISQSPNDNESRSSNGEPPSKYLKQSHTRTDQYRNNLPIKPEPSPVKTDPFPVKTETYPDYLDDRGADGSPIAPPVIMEDSPVKGEPGRQLGNAKRNRYSESEDDHPTLDGSAPPSLKPVNIQNLGNSPYGSSARSYGNDAQGSSARGYRGIDIDLSGKTADLPDAPYAKPERPHYKVEDQAVRTNKSLAFVVNDAVPKRSDFPVKTVGDLTEYAHDRNDYASRHSEPPPTVRPASQNTGSAPVTVLTNAMGQRIDISDTRNNSLDNPYKPPPSWRPEDPAEMCKNLTVSFFKSKLNRIGRPVRNLNVPRFKGHRFARDYTPNMQAIKKLDHLIFESERRAERRRKEEIALRSRLESDLRSRNAGDGNFELSTEDEMRQLQQRLGRELRNDAFDAEEESYLEDMLSLNMGFSTRRGGAMDSHRRAERSYSYDRERDRDRNRNY